MAGTPSPIAEHNTNMGVLELGLRAASELPRLHPGSRGSLMLSANVPLKDPDIMVSQAIGTSGHVNIRGIPYSAKGVNLKANMDFRLSENVHVDVSYAYTRFISDNAKNRHSLQGKLSYFF